MTSPDPSRYCTRTHAHGPHDIVLEESPGYSRRSHCSGMDDGDLRPELDRAATNSIRALRRKFADAGFPDAAVDRAVERALDKTRSDAT